MHIFIVKINEIKYDNDKKKSVVNDLLWNTHFFTKTLQ